MGWRVIEVRRRGGFMERDGGPWRVDGPLAIALADNPERARLRIVVLDLNRDRFRPPKAAPE